MKKSLLFKFLLLFVITANAQFVPKMVQEDNEAIRSLCENVAPEGWLYFKESEELSAEEFLSNYSSDIGLTAGGEMRIIKNEIDEISITHKRYQQYYQGVMVEDGEILLHSKDNVLFVGNGNIVEDLSINIIPTISSTNALTVATASIGAKAYAWEEETWEEEIKHEKNDVTATNKPTGELRIISAEDNLWLGQNCKLVWFFEILALDPFEPYKAYIDAQTGEVIKIISQMHNCNGQGGIFTNMRTGLNTSFDIRHRGWPNYDYTLEDCSRGNGIETRHFTIPNVQGLPLPWSSLNRITNSSASWGTTEQVATYAQWCVEKAWDYFYTKHNYNGWNGSGKEVHIHVNWLDGAGNPVVNAAYFHSGITHGLLFGTTNANNPYISIDVAGHEFTHGVVDYTGNLKIERESGALNEGYADIFGAMIERFVTPNGPNIWIHTEEVFPSLGLRDMRNPLVHNQPNIVWGGFYVDPSQVACPNPNPQNDMCGVHRNMSIITRCFNLLAMSNAPQQNNLTVIPIGEDNASRIAFRALKCYTNKNDGFVNARLAWQQSAIDLFGGCSQPVISVRDAWAAVGVGNTMGGCISIAGPSIILKCEDDPLAIYIATSIPSNTVNWFAPASWNTTISGNALTVHSVPANGNFTVSAGGSWNGISYFLPKSVKVKSCPVERYANPNMASFTVYPNPASEKLNIISANNNPIQIRIMDISGKFVLETSEIPSNSTIDISSLASGFYLIELKNDEAKDMQTIQIIK